MDKLLDIKEAAQLLRVKESWLRSAIFNRKIPFVKIGRLIRFREKDLNNFVEDNCSEL